MKTIKEIADEIGISKQRVYRYIKTASVMHITDAGVMRLDETAEAQLKAHFINSAPHYEPHHDMHQAASLDVVLMQLENKDKQIQNLQEALAREQMLHLATQQRLAGLLEAPKAEKQSRWERLKAAWRE